jgi:hypothetical protein
MKRDGGRDDETAVDRRGPIRTQGAAERRTSRQGRHVGGRGDELRRPNGCGGPGFGALPAWRTDTKNGRRPRESERLPLNLANWRFRCAARSPTCSAFPAPEIGPGRPFQAAPMDPEFTSARRCRPLTGHVRRWGRYSSTCHRQKVTCGLRNNRTIGTSLNAWSDTHTLTLERAPGKAFLPNIGWNLRLIRVGWMNAYLRVPVR